MEMLSIYDDNKQNTGREIERGNKSGLAENENILLTVVYLKWQDKFLIQKVSESKGGVYAVTGGHVPSGFTSSKQAVIECEEELGIKLDEKKLKFLGFEHGKHAFVDVYEYELEKFIPENEFVLQEEEVESVYWMDKTQIEKLIEDGVLRKSSVNTYLKFIK